jgi:diguanylate cyclase (GGDEF)-like protein
VEHHFPPKPGTETGSDSSAQEHEPGPEPGVKDDDPSDAYPSGDEETEVVDLGTELVADLATDRSGLAIIYRALDGLVERYALHDAAVVIDEAGLGRQVFRSGRKPLDDPGGEALLDAEPGLYTDPPLEAAAVDAKLLNSLCVLALRMEVLRYDSWHDPLTGLFDRRSFDRLLEMSVARSLRYHWPFTLVVIDLDGLKEINDTQGHPAGDAAIQALSERFRRVLRFGDNAARIGGDEFAVILPNTDPDDVPMLLERIGSSQLGADRPCPPFSYGVAQCPAEADDMDSLFKLADSRLYEAKKARR